jgi:hypothetical protein
MRACAADALHSRSALNASLRERGTFLVFDMLSPDFLVDVRNAS